METPNVSHARAVKHIESRQIKQEMINLAVANVATTSLVDVPMEDDDSGMSGSMLLSDVRTIIEEAESVTSDTLSSSKQIQMEASPSISKRKSVDMAESNQQKKLHMTMGINPSVITDDRAGDSKQTDSTIDTETVGTKTFGESNRTENSVVRNLPSTTKSVKTRVNIYQKESDYEWEVISKKITSAHNNSTMRENDSKNGWKNTRISPQHKVGTRMKSNVKVLTTTKMTHNNKERMETRGEQMTEVKETLITPLKVEFNINHTTGEFNIILAVKNLFSLMAEIDSSMKVYNNERTVLLWEVHGHLCEEDEFVSYFKMREQNFRNGNMKVTVYFTVESNYTINSMKFRDPVKNFLLTNNIWVKPDFYSTKTVSSPGFFTMIHPRITNKQKCGELLRRELSKLDINEGDEIVQEWIQRKNGTGTNLSDNIPQFHLESGIRKWGDIKVEVLTLYCSKEDVQYVKYLMAEASSQSIFNNGLFVPTGIHLLEGKEVLTALLLEHESFLQKVTSLQISGITPTEIYHTGEGQESSTLALFLQCQGVWAVEPTFSTEKHGNWLLVVDKLSIQQVSEYIKSNLGKIYRNRSGQVPKVVDEGQRKEANGYKLLLVDKIVSKVGSYAEVLKRRFQTNDQSTTSNINKPDVKRKIQTPRNTQVFKDKVDVGKEHNTKGNERATGSLRKREEVRESTDSQEQGIAKRATLRGSSTILEKENLQQAAHTVTKREVHEEQMRLSKELFKEAEQNIEKKIQQMETKFSAQLKEVELQNQTIVTDIEQSVEKRVEAVISMKLREASQMVADTVTYRMINTMNRMMQNKGKQLETSTEDEQSMYEKGFPSQNIDTYDIGDGVVAVAVV